MSGTTEDCNKMNTLFAFQIVPGSDDLLAYCRTIEQALSEAAEYRRELARDLDDEGKDGVPAISLYELRIKPLTLDLLLPSLNREQELPEALIEEMTYAGAVE